MAGRLAPIRLALAQIDARVGDIDGNAEVIRDRTAAAREAGAELVLFPELALTGYPPEDLLLKEHFLRRAREALEALAAETRDIVALVGFPERTEDVYNACAGGEHLLALRSLADVEGRGGDVHDDVRAGDRELSGRRPRLPDVLAHSRPDERLPEAGRRSPEPDWK